MKRKCGYVHYGVTAPRLATIYIHFSQSCDTGNSLSPNASKLFDFSDPSHVPSGEIVLLIRPMKKIVVDFPLKIDKNICDDQKIISIFVPASGKMQEWLIWHAWKACEPLKGSGGSNPPLSADKNLKKIRELEIKF